jgi:hypothetical protein
MPFSLITFRPVKINIVHKENIPYETEYKKHTISRRNNLLVENLAGQLNY